MDSQQLLAHYAVQAKMARNLLPAYVLPQQDQDERPTGNGIVFLVGERGRLIPYGPIAPFCSPSATSAAPPQASTHRQQKTHQYRAHETKAQQRNAPQCSVPLSTTTPHFAPDYNNCQQSYQLCQQYDGSMHGMENTDAVSQQYHHHHWTTAEEDTNAVACSSASTTRLGSAYSDGASVSAHVKS